ncbi:MAG: hypothetical protein JNL72_01080 [Flavipsychrobacter sp.]|nr:hypothetical protein [Flavipsychrobacter sp.]
MKKLMYATDKDGKYTGVTSSGWEAENEATRQAWEDADETLAQTEAQVRQGSLSPIAYYMQKNLMELSLLAKYVGKWQWQVKRHMRPSVFRKMDAALLQKYAEVFNITTEELSNFGK